MKTRGMAAADNRQGGEKLLGALGLCRRAGALAIGFDAVRGAIDSGQAALVLVAQDTSERTQKRICEGCDCPVAHMPLAQQDIASITRKPAGVLAVINKDLAILCQNALDM